MSGRTINMDAVRGRLKRGVQLETAHWPMLIVRFERQITDDDFAAYLDRMSTMLSRRERHAVVLDASVASLPSLTRARLQALWMRQHRDAIAELCAGIAFVFPSRLFRHVMNAVFMLQPLPGQFYVANTLDDATGWAAARLGIEKPAAGLDWSDDETTSPNVRPQSLRSSTDEP